MTTVIGKGMPQTRGVPKRSSLRPFKCLTAVSDGKIS
jgi:hypothetical protein